MAKYFQNFLSPQKKVVPLLTAAILYHFAKLATFSQFVLKKSCSDYIKFAIFCKLNLSLLLYLSLHFLILSYNSNKNILMLCFCTALFFLFFTIIAILIEKPIKLRVMSQLKQNSSLQGIVDNLLTGKAGAEILSSQGPGIEQFNKSYQRQCSIKNLSCGQFINKIETIAQKQIKLAGTGREGLLRSFSFILLAIGCKQSKYYPHLLTLIKQQFFKPGVFADIDPHKKNRVLNICRNIQIQLISAGDVFQFLESNDQFLCGFQHVLNKIILPNEPVAQSIENLRKKFNIDCGKMQIPSISTQCWILGMQRKMYLFMENNLFIIVSASTSTEPTRTMNESAIQNRVQSERSISEMGQQVIIQASQESTPKFKDNQESIRYRKKSHKNSFGGDFQITGYKELAKLVNKSQAGGDDHKQKSRVRKVFSLKFQMQQMGCLTLQDSPIEKNEAEVQQLGNQASAHEGDFQLNIVKNQVQMRGSNIEGNQSRDKRQKKERGQRKKHITSSQIFELGKNLKTSDKYFLTPKLQQQKNSNSNSNSNKGETKQQKKDIPINNEQSKQNQKQKQIQGIQYLTQQPGTPKQNFKFSFSKKDSNKFVFKEIQSQYHDNEQQIAQNNFQGHIASTGMKSSLTNIRNAGMLSENQYYRKREQNRRSLLLQKTINPIQQQVQSSQQEKTQEQSVAQSQRERDLYIEQNNQDIDKKSHKSHSQPKEQQNSLSLQYKENNGQRGNKNGQSAEQAQAINNGIKNYINIFKNKNRKFSYLTQPISISKNSLFGANNTQLRQSYIDQANQIQHESGQGKTSPVINHHHGTHHKNRNAKVHKNSQAITQSKHNKRRFEQNPISFSQMIANINNGREQSNFSGHSAKNNGHANKRVPRLSLNNRVIEFTKNNILCYNQPEGWTRKQVIYYFSQLNALDALGNNYYSYDQHSKRPERYIIDRSIISLEDVSQNSSTNQYVHNNQMNGLNINMNTNAKPGMQQINRGFLKQNMDQNINKIQQNIHYNYPKFTKNHFAYIASNQLNGKGAQVGLQSANQRQDDSKSKGQIKLHPQLLNTPVTNIRSTIDTAKNTMSQTQGFGKNKNSNKNSSVKNSNNSQQRYKEEKKAESLFSNSNLKSKETQAMLNNHQNPFKEIKQITIDKIDLNIATNPSINQLNKQKFETAEANKYQPPYFIIKNEHKFSPNMTNNNIKMGYQPYQQITNNAHFFPHFVNKNMSPVNHSNNQNSIVPSISLNDIRVARFNTQTKIIDQVYRSPKNRSHTMLYSPPHSSIGHSIPNVENHVNISNKHIQHNLSSPANYNQVISHSPHHYSINSKNSSFNSISYTQAHKNIVGLQAKNDGSSKKISSTMVGPSPTSRTFSSYSSSHPILPTHSATGSNNSYPNHAYNYNHTHNQTKVGSPPLYAHPNGPISPSSFPHTFQYAH